MARQIYSVIGSANPTTADYETRVNALLAPLLSQVITAFDIILTDKAPSSTRFLRTVVDTNTTGAVVLTSPFLVKAVQAEDEASAIAAMQTFIGTIPTNFISPVFYQFSDQAAGQPFRVVLIVVYCADAAGAATNWQVSTGGSGGGGGGGQATLVLGAGVTVVESFPFATTEGLEIDYVLTKGSVRYASELRVTHDGAAAYYSESGTSVTPGVVDATLSADISGPNLRLIATTGSAGWTLRWIVRQLTT